MLLTLLALPLRMVAQLPEDPVEVTETQSSTQPLDFVAGLFVSTNPMLVETMALILSRAADTEGSW
jgi:hypothetical protein